MMPPTILDILLKIQNKRSLDKTDVKSTPLEKEKDVALNDLIQIGESNTLEFKA